MLNAPQLVPFAAVVTGDWNRAISLLTAGSEAARRRGNRNEWTQLVVVLATTHARLKDRQTASRLAREVLETMVDDPAPYYELPMRSLLARLDVDADVHLDACAEICRDHDYRGLTGAVALASAETLARAGEHERAQAAYAEASGIFRSYSLRIDEADTLASWSRALATAGDAAGAEERAEQCGAQLDEINAPRWRAVLLGGAS